MGCYVNIIAGRKDDFGSQYIKVLKAIGYDYVELPIAQIMQRNDWEFQAILRELRKKYLPCCARTICFLYHFG